MDEYYARGLVLHSLSDNWLADLRFDARHVESLKALGECRGKQALFFRQTPEVLEALRQTAIIESTVSSNRLEGITAPQKRVRTIVRQPTAARNRSEQEIAGYRDALALIHDAAEHLYLSNNIIRQLHQMLYRYLPDAGGEWKREDNEIVERDADGRVTRIRFTPTAAADTPAAMEALVVRYKRARRDARVEPLILVPLTILDFLCIHPFADGNGRVGRLLTLLLLYQADYQVGRFVSLERIFEESKETYYDALEHSSQGWHTGTHDPFPWLTYCWGALLRAYDEFERRVGSIRTSGYGSKTELVRQAVTQQAKPFCISDIEDACPTVSRDMIRNVLRQLRDEGVIEVEGVGRGARWRRIGGG